MDRRARHSHIPRMGLTTARTALAWLVGASGDTEATTTSVKSRCDAVAFGSSHVTPRIRVLRTKSSPQATLDRGTHVSNGASLYELCGLVALPRFLMGQHLTSPRKSYCSKNLRFWYSTARSASGLSCRREELLQNSYQNQRFIT
jgi:hypothetical protein